MAIPCRVKSAQHQALNIAGLAGFLVAIDHHCAQTHIAGGRLEAYRHAVKELANDELFLHSDDAVIRAGHADIGNVGRSFGQNTFVRGGHVCVGADYRSDASVEVPAERNLFRSCLGVEIDEDYLGFNFLQKLVGGAKGIVIRSHENASLKVDDGIRNFRLAALVQAPAGHIRGIVCGAKHAALGAVAVAFGHLKKIDDFALIPDVVAGGDDINIQFEQFFRETGSDAETRRRVFTVGDDKIDGLVADNAGQLVLDDGASGTPEDVANEENSHEAG